MSTDIIIERCASVDLPGANDLWMVVVDGHQRGAGPCRSGPNHRAPQSKGGGPWNNHYGCLAFGSYEYECLIHRKYGKSLLLNHGGQCNSCVPNPRHSGEYYLEGVFIHSWHSKTWPGSAGCPTIPKLWWPCFQSFFRPCMTGTLEVIPHP